MNGLLLLVLGEGKHQPKKLCLKQDGTGLNI